MARHYSAKDFFRQMPNALLARYFHGRGVFDDLDFAALKEGKPGELFAAWLDLPEEQRNATDVEFRDIFEMSCEKGFRAIIDEARWRMRAKPEALTSFIETGPIPISAQPAAGRSATAVCANQTIHPSTRKRARSTCVRTCALHSPPRFATARCRPRSQRGDWGPSLTLRSTSARDGCRHRRCGGESTSGTGSLQGRNCGAGCRR